MNDSSQGLLICRRTWQLNYGDKRHSIVTKSDSKWYILDEYVEMVNEIEGDMNDTLQKKTMTLNAYLLRQIKWLKI